MKSIERFIIAGIIVMIGHSMTTQIAYASLSKAVESNGIFNSLNYGLALILGVAGFVVVGGIIFAGAKLSTAGSPQARTQGFIGLGMALFGGWVVYRCLHIAGWIKGFGG